MESTGSTHVDPRRTSVLLPQAVRPEGWSKLVTRHTDFDIALLEGHQRVRLVPEPTNQAHNRAVKVCIDEIHLGYLEWDQAEYISDLIEEFTLNEVYCDLHVKLWRDWRVANLLMGDLDKFWDWLVIGGVPPLGSAGHSYHIHRDRLWIKRRGRYQAALRQLISGESEACVDARFEVGETQRGKYAGEAHITVLVGDLVIGELPAQFRDRDLQHATFYEAIIRGEVASCVLKLCWLQEVDAPKAWVIGAEKVSIETEYFDFL